jgi:hypothetical protein
MVPTTESQTSSPTAVWPARHVAAVADHERPTEQRQRHTTGEQILDGRTPNQESGSTERDSVRYDVTAGLLGWSAKITV